MVSDKLDSFTADAKAIAWLRYSIQGVIMHNRFFTDDDRGD